jgi:AcrR family transcriptional regulator
VNADPKGQIPGTTEGPLGTQPVWKPCADARRNRGRRLEVAKAGFADEGRGVSLDEISRRGGVGIGTLYRYRPTCDAIVEAVYRREVQQLASSASRLLGSLSPGLGGAVVAVGLGNPGAARAVVAVPEAAVHEDGM